MSDMVAFLVQETDEWTGDIIFARSPIEARRYGAQEFNDGELGGMSVKRARWADQFAGKGVPARELIARGWHFEGCPSCGVRLEESALYDAGKRVDDVVGTTGGLAYCCARCRWREMKRARRLKAEGQRAIDALKAVVAARFPGAQFCDKPRDGHRWHHHAHVVEGRRGGYHWLAVMVALAFPGMRIDLRPLSSTPIFNGVTGPSRLTTTAATATVRRALGHVADSYRARRAAGTGSTTECDRSGCPAQRRYHAIAAVAAAAEPPMATGRL